MMPVVCLFQMQYIDWPLAQVLQVRANEAARAADILVTWKYPRLRQILELLPGRFP